jgi:hypothetical protein
MSIYTASNNVNYSYVEGSGVATVAVSASATGAITILSSFVVNDVTYNVTSIGAQAFQFRSGLTSVIIPDSVTSIGDYAFQSCTGLTSVIIPDSVTSIGENAFRYCTGLTSVSIGTGVTSIVTGAFGGCTLLTSITVDENNSNYSSLDGVLFNKVKSILIRFPGGKTGFYIIPDSVTSIDENAFQGCTGLTSVIIPDSVTSINYNAFFQCSGLTSVTIGTGVTNIGDQAFRLCTGLRSVIIPDSVTSINEYAFQSTGLTSVSIGTGVTSIGQQAFGSCIGLTSVTFNGAIPTIGTNNFTVSGDTAYYLVDATNSINTNEPSVLSKLTMFTNTVAVLTTPTTTYISQNFYLTEEFDVSANGVTAAVFDAEDTTDVSGNYPNKAEIRVEKSVVQNMFQYWTDAIDMSNAVVSDIFYRVSYTDSAVPLSPDFVVGAIMTASDPNMNPDSNLTNYLPQDYLRYLAKKLFNTTRGVDLFANETEVLQSVNTRCRVGLNQILLTYLDASANGIIRDEDDFIILDPYDPVEVAGSQKVTGNPAKKIMKQILSNDPARFVDISSNYAVAGQTYWYKMPIEVGDNLYFPVTIKAPTDQQKLTQPDSTTLIEDRTYLIRCVVVADGSIPSPYNVYSYSALPSLTTFYH